jgi:hypothetical protein
MYLSRMIDFGWMCWPRRASSRRRPPGALKAEARHRAAADRFFGHIAYASVLAHRTG